MRKFTHKLALGLSLGFTIVASAQAQAPEERYQDPVPALRSLVDAPNPPELSIDPQGRTLLQSTRRGFLRIGDLARSELKLGGLRFNPESRASVREKYLERLALRPLVGGTAREVAGLPAEARMTEVQWSPDGKKIALVHVADSDSQLWIVDVATAQARRVPAIRLNGTAGFDVHWMPDSLSLTVLAVPGQPGKAPQESLVPSGPSIQEHQGGKASARTYQDLLKTPYDEDLLDYYLTSQVMWVKADGSLSKALTRPGIYVGASPSPDGKYFLVTSLHRPYSYSLPISSFPIKSEVLDLAGKSVRVIRDLPLEVNSPPDFDAVRPGPRSLEWRADAPATLCWVETLDDGDSRKAVDFREQLYLWSPGQAQPQAWLRLTQRYRGVDWGERQNVLVHEGLWKTRKSKTLWVRPGEAPVVLFDRSTEDRYNDPGKPLFKRQPNGHSLFMLSADGKSIYLSGAGASPEGDRPFLHRFDLASKTREELFRSQAPNFERPVRLMDPEARGLLTLRESLKEPSNLYLRELGTEKSQQLTDFSDPAPQLQGIKKEILTYKRADGVQLTGTLYTPPGYDAKRDGRLPVFVWAYPGEFKSAAVAGQVKDSPHRFIRPFWGGPLFFVMRGYAVLENPTFPIIGEGNKEPNDTYLEQLVMNAQAAVDAVVDSGVGDRDRCAIGGHSYGAFTTANLLAHSDIFRAGIARSGAYNRTLTPFGFQSEERTYWEAQDIYTKMSPFTYAHKIDEPLLMIHGAEDSNSGTFPMQSERLYQAVKGLGGKVRLVMLPKESHSYAARESVLHTLYEMDNWLEFHVKKAGPRLKGGTP